MIKKIIDSIADDKKDHVLLGMYWGFLLMVVGFIFDILTSNYYFTYIGLGIATLLVGGKEVILDWLLKKGNPEWWDFIASFIPIFMMVVAYTFALILIM